MASSIGSLVVRLSLDAAEFTSGLTKSEYEARKFAKSIDDGIRTAANVATVALSAMAVAATATYAAINELAKQAGNFQDLAEQIGGNAESLASFSVAAQVAGTNIASVAEASVKLTKNLSGVDDESKAAGAALAALGIPIKEFKALDPATQIEVVAKAMAGFDDGTQKVAVALALFGKSGAQLLPFLKELEQQGGRQVILTQEQIRQADEYSDKQARVRAELNLYAQVAATQALPAITALTGAVKDFIAEIVGMDRESKKLRDSNAVADFANEAVRALAFVADSADSIGRIFRVTGNVIGATAAQIGALADGDLKRYNAIQEDASRTIDGIIAKQTLRFRVEKNIADQAKNAQLRNVEDRGFTPPGKKLDFSGALGGGNASAARERISDAERYADSLAKTLQGTLNLNTAETALVEIYGLRRNALSGLTPELEATILDYAQQIDYAKELEKQERAAAQAEQEAQRIRANIRREAESARREAQSIVDGNEQIREQIILLREGQAALDAYTSAKLLKAAAEKDDLAATLAAVGASDEVVAAIKEQAAALRERQQLLGDRSLAEQFKKDAQALQDTKNLFSDALVGPLTDFVTGTKSAKDAFRAFADDLTRQIARIAAQNIANKIFGGNNSSGPDIFGVLAKLAGSFLGGGSSTGGGVPGVGFSGGGFGEHFANGTKYAPGGLAWVGEHGPELRYIPRGAQVLPNLNSSRSGGYGREVHINLTMPIMPGATAASAHQSAAAARKVLVNSMKNAN